MAVRNTVKAIQDIMRQDAGVDPGTHAGRRRHPNRGRSHQFTAPLGIQLHFQLFVWFRITFSALCGRSELDT